MIYLILLLLSFNVVADQISYQEGSRFAETDSYHTSADRRLQYNYGDDKYAFFQIRRIGICPSYCGFNYDMAGLGLGINHHFDKFSLFAQGGYYIVKNTIGHVKWDENLYYYFRSKPFGDYPATPKSFEVQNDNAFALTVGMDIPFNENFGFKVSYQHLKIKENIIARFDEVPGSLNLWWVPVNQNLSTLGAGLYWKF